MAAFELESFIDACRRAVTGSDAELHVRELVAEAVRDPRIAGVLGEPEHAGLRPLHRAADLTVIDFTWAPVQCFKPHNHNMWAVIALISGREDNVLWQRRGDTIEAVGACSLGAGAVTILPVDAIHSVTNPIGKRTRAIHVYGGDFFAPPQPRSEWDHETLVERPWDIEDTRRRFAEAEARFARG
jgi:predicted metal-dependent enzyme (double-stranded beta helix superfamily)